MPIRTSVLIALDCSSEDCYRPDDEEYRPETVIADTLRMIVQELEAGVAISDMHMRELLTPDGVRFGRIMIR